jgi:hypothetical protein
MVKKLETVLAAEFMTSPLSELRLAYYPPPLAYSTAIVDSTGGGGKAYGLEDIVGVPHGNRRS